MKLNGPKNRDICSDFGVGGYPTVFIFAKEYKLPISTFRGDRSIKNLIKWAETAMSPDFEPEEFVM